MKAFVIVIIACGTAIAYAVLSAESQPLLIAGLLGGIYACELLQTL